MTSSLARLTQTNGGKGRERGGGGLFCQRRQFSLFSLYESARLFFSLLCWTKAPFYCFLCARAIVHARRLLRSELA